MKLSRRKDRLTALDYINGILRISQNCTATGDAGMMTRPLWAASDFNGRPVTVIGVQKGKIRRRIFVGISACRPRKATGKHCVSCSRRKKFGRPIVTFVDTPVLPVAWRRKSGDRARPSPEIFWKCRRLRVPALLLS